MLCEKLAVANSTAQARRRLRAPWKKFNPEAEETKTSHTGINDHDHVRSSMTSAGIRIDRDDSSFSVATAVNNTNNAHYPDRYRAHATVVLAEVSVNELVHTPFGRHVALTKRRPRRGTRKSSKHLAPTHVQQQLQMQGDPRRKHCAS